MAEAPSRTVLVLLVVLVLVVAGGLSVFVYLKGRSSGPPSQLTARVGSNVTVNYVGYFGSGPDSGKVFDTSLYSVASNNASYAKSLEFQSRGGPRAYSPLGVHIGASTPQGGYTIGNLTFVQVVTGFWQGLIGLPGNLTSRLVIPPSLGYGVANPACFRTLPLVYTLPVFQTLPIARFTTLYPGISPAVGVQFPDPHYGWNVSVYSANASWVTIANQPPVGFVASPAGWPAVVTGIQSTTNGSGAITLANQLSPNQAGHLLGHDFNGTGPCTAQSQGRFTVSAVDEANGTYTEDFNTQVTGQVLIFVVTIELILP